ncbi:hypothetical protein DORLON_00850 [Dorea longicatena DSM 13814]|uniref:Uncharacterized protein n=1 Tax=Dorea longicatena DSM 13814 TaxID=411462 RepID=A6BEY0_9FIRM|nr:hypothetical protein DORLON_00850 [Dorea longicatena DSM 13814]
MKQQETTRDNRKEQVICFCGKATAHMIQKQIKEGCET